MWQTKVCAGDNRSNPRTWIVKIKICGLGQLKGNIFIGSRIKSRTCIYIPKHIETLLLQGLTGADLTAVEASCTIDNTKTKIVFASAYLPGESDGPSPTKELEDLVQYFENNKKTPNHWMRL